MEYTKEIIDAGAYTLIGTEATYDEPYGRMALRQVEAHETITADGKYIPFHALGALFVQKTHDTVEKPNPYGCEAPNDPETDSKSPKVCVGETCAMKVACN